MIAAPYVANESVRLTLELCRTHPKECTCEQCTAIFDLASDHRYECKCAICAFWWERMPPEDEADDYDMGEFYASHREARKAKRANNRAASAEILTQKRIPFVSKNDGAHLIITFGGKTVDFWPGTGRWKCRTGKTGRGVQSLIQYIYPSRKSA